MVWAVRYALTQGIIGPGIELPAVYREMSSHYPWTSWRVWFINIITAYRWAWLVLLLPLFTGGPWLQKGILLSCLLLGAFASATVADVSRSMGFMFPAFLVAACAVHGSVRTRNRILIGAVILCIVTPSFHVQDTSSGQGINIQPLYPLPISLMRAWFDIDVLSALK